MQTLFASLKNYREHEKFCFVTDYKWGKSFLFLFDTCVRLQRGCASMPSPQANIREVTRYFEGFEGVCWR